MATELHNAVVTSAGVVKNGRRRTLWLHLDVPGLGPASAAWPIGGSNAERWALGDNLHVWGFTSDDLDWLGRARVEQLAEALIGREAIVPIASEEHDGALYYTVKPGGHPLVGLGFLPGPLPGIHDGNYRARRGELVEAGLVESSGETRLTEHGRQTQENGKGDGTRAIVWRPTFTLDPAKDPDKLRTAYMVAYRYRAQKVSLATLEADIAQRESEAWHSVFFPGAA